MQAVCRVMIQSDGVECKYATPLLMYAQELTPDSCYLITLQDLTLSTPYVSVSGRGALWQPRTTCFDLDSNMYLCTVILFKTKQDASVLGMPHHSRLAYNFYVLQM